MYILYQLSVRERERETGTERERQRERERHREKERREIMPLHTCTHGLQSSLKVKIAVILVYKQVCMH
jgi:hypothetical protein